MSIHTYSSLITTQDELLALVMEVDINGDGTIGI